MFTLNDTVIRVNQVLNYPALTLDDILHFFDQAISELNSSFRIGIPSITKLIAEHKFVLQEEPNILSLNSVPNTSIPEWNTQTTPDTAQLYSVRKTHSFKLYNKITSQWDDVTEAYGVHLTPSYQTTIYKPMWLANETAIWTPLDTNRLNDFDLTEYLPYDWIVLFVIPYICSKAAVRDGGNNTTFVEEYVQGFQQMQTSYNVPNFVILKDVCHLPAYKKVVAEYLKTNASLDISIPTRAVYDTMKIGNSAQYIPTGFYIEGGWGI